MRIAYIGIKGLPSQAGVDRVVESLLRHLDKRRFEAVVYCSRDLTPNTYHLDNVDIIRLPTLRGKYLHATSLYLMASLHALFRSKYDLIHLHNVEASFILPLLRLRYRVISTSHASVRGIGKCGKAAQAIFKLT